MEFQDRMKINRHKEILKRGQYFTSVLCDRDKDRVLPIIERSREFLNKTFTEKNVLLNPTIREMATFKISVLRYIRTDLMNIATDRIKLPSEDLDNIDGICAKCIRDDPEQDMCEKCWALYNHRMSIYNVQFHRRRAIECDFNDAVQKTTFSDELTGNWLLLMRKNKDKEESTHIDKVLKSFIRDELVDEFKKQNPELIKKYDL